MRRAAVLALALAACSAPPKPVAEPRHGAGDRGDGDGDEDGEVERGAIPDDVVGPPKVAWAELDHAQRVRFMERVIVPTMKPLFVAFDGARFKDFGCATCHGAGVADHSYKLPNAALFALPADRAQLARDKPEWLKLMSSEVEPEMAKLLGLPELDPAHPTPSAFGCARCHPSGS